MADKGLEKDKAIRIMKSTISVLNSPDSAKIIHDFFQDKTSSYVLNEYSIMINWPYFKKKHKKP